MNIGKLVLGAAALAGAYYLSKQDVQVGSDGIQRFSPDALKKVKGILLRAGLGDTPASQASGAFAMTIIPGASEQRELPNAAKFINGLMSDGMKVLVSKNVLDDAALKGLQAIVVPVSVEGAFDGAKSGSRFVML